MNSGNGFSLSQEELLAALLIADLRAPIGYDDLDGQVLGDLNEEGRLAIAAMAERSLVARGFLEVRSEDESVLDAQVLALLTACTEPTRTWAVIHQQAGVEPRASYFHQNATVTLAHVALLGVHQFLQLDGVADIQSTVTQLVNPVTNNAPAAIAGTIPENTFAEFVNSESRPSPDAMVRQLQAAGWDKAAATAFTEALARGVSITAFSRYNHTVEPQLQRAFTVVRGQESNWIMTLTPNGAIQARAVDGAGVLRGLQEFAQVV